MNWFAGPNEFEQAHVRKLPASTAVVWSDKQTAQSILSIAPNPLAAEGCRTETRIEDPAPGVV